MNRDKVIESLRTKIELLRATQKGKRGQLSKVGLSSKLGLGEDAIKNITDIKNKSIPDYDTLWKIAKFFGVSPDYLTSFYEEGEDINLHMKSLLFSVKNIEGFSVEIENGSLCIRCDNPKLIDIIYNAFHNIGCGLDESARLMLFHGKVIFESDFWELKKRFYLYGDLVEFDADDDPSIDDYINELDKVYRDNDEEDVVSEERLEEWNRTLRHPNNYLSEVYYDVIYKDYETEKPSSP